MAYRLISIFLLFILSGIVYGSSAVSDLQISLNQPAPAVEIIILSNNDLAEKTIHFKPNSHIRVLQEKPAGIDDNNIASCQFSDKRKNFLIPANNTCAIYVRAKPAAVDVGTINSTLNAIIQSTSNDNTRTSITFSFGTRSSLFVAQRDLPIVYQLVSPHTLQRIINGPSQNDFMHVFSLAFDSNGMLYVGGNEAADFGLARANLATNTFDRIEANLSNGKQAGSIYSVIIDSQTNSLYAGGTRTEYNPSSYHVGCLYSLDLTQPSNRLQPIGGEDPLRSTDDGNQTAVLNVALSPWLNGLVHDLFSAGGIPDILTSTNKSMPTNNQTRYHFRNFVARYYPRQDKWHYVPRSRILFKSPVMKLLLTQRQLYAISHDNIFYTSDVKINKQWQPIQLPNDATWMKLGSGTILKRDKGGILLGGLTSNLTHLVYLKAGKATNVATSGIPPQYYVNQMITDPVSGAIYFATTSVRYASNLIWPGQLIEYKDGKTSVLIDNNAGGFAVSSLTIGTAFTQFELLKSVPG
jgi:hypothetical protein